MIRTLDGLRHEMKVQINEELAALIAVVGLAALGMTVALAIPMDPAPQQSPGGGSANRASPLAYLSQQSTSSTDIRP